MSSRSGAAGGAEAAMAELLRSVGVESYEPRLLAALAECAKREAGRDRLPMQRQSVEESAEGGG